MSTLTYLSFAVLLVPLFVVPGWLWLRRLGVEPVLALYLGPGVTALVGAAIVALGLLLPWSVRATCVGGALVIAASAIVCGVTAPRPLGPARGDLTGMVVFIVAFLSMAAFSGVPSAPYGMWSSDTVGPARADSPRWPGLPIDNTLPYRTGQVALYKQGGNAIRDGYSPGWWLSDRTPLTGLDFAFAAGAMGIHVSPSNLEEEAGKLVPMLETDPQGFWSYQVVAMFLNLAIILGVYVLARVWLTRHVATLAALITAVMPGLFLNGIYTWPKQAVAYFLLGAAACLIRRRPLALAGVFAGLAFLTHPVGVLWIPGLAVLALSDAELRARTRRTLGLFLGAAAVVAAPWELFTSLVMHATSRWITAPLGVLLPDPRHLGTSLNMAWHGFLDNGVLFIFWARIESTAGSLYPLNLAATPSKAPPHGYGPQIMVSWSAAHGFSVWGMAGLVLAPFAVLTAVKHWAVFRRLALRLVAPAVIVVEIWNGETYPFANQSMFALVGLLAIVA
ncbi:MAG: glycosyltransferase family 39 protein, partial [Actinomycetota bacterium]|nr:glycosyltransferase family 39 protein [Actinomycetota bacterium]